MNKFNRQYLEFKPNSASGNGPSTKRICKKAKCEDEKTKSNTPPTNE
jgi:hypothetical protein